MVDISFVSYTSIASFLTIYFITWLFPKIVKIKLYTKSKKIKRKRMKYENLYEAWQNVTKYIID